MLAGNIFNQFQDSHHSLVFDILTKNSLNDRATGGVALLINKSYLFSEVHLNTPLQAVAARVTLNKVVNMECARLSSQLRGACSAFEKV